MARKLLFLVVAVAMAAGDLSRPNLKNGDFFAKTRFEPRTKISSRNIRFSRMQTMEDMFNVYDATFLAYVWPKLRNGVHLSVETACWDNLTEFFKDLLEGRPWAYSAVDASGRYESGLYEGNRFWLGSKQQCLQLDADYTNSVSNKTKTVKEAHSENGFANVAFLRERYFDRSPESDWSGLALPSEQVVQKLPAAVPFRMSYYSVKFSLNVTKPSFRSHDIILGLCLPRACASDDLHSILDFSIMINDNLKSNRTLPRVAKITSVHAIHAYYDIRDDATALLLVILTSFLVLLALIATAVDYGLIKFKPRNCKSMSFDLAAAHPDRLSEIPMPNNKLDVPVHKKHDKPTNIVDMETLTINNMNNASMINLVSVKKVLKPDANPPSITLDVIAVDEMKHDSCNRCGKYRKQCANQRKMDNLPACPRMKYNNSRTSLDAKEQRKCSKHEFCKNILLCFSLRQSWHRICNRNLANKDLSPIHVLKIIATLWVVYVEVATVVAYVSNNAGDINEHKTPFNILVTGTLAFDTLFFISGVFSAHHFFYLKRRYSVEELVSFGGCCGHALQFVCFVTNRAVRLLPPYMYAIFLTSVLSRATLQTSPLETPEADHTTCDSYWWTNLLYVNSFYGAETRCMRVSWYLSLESQLHALAALLLCCGRLRAAAAAAACFVLAAAAADLTTAYRDFETSIHDSFSMYELVLDRPWSRVFPYFVGVFTGWLVHKLDGGLVVSKLKALCLWSVSLLAVGSLLLAAWWSRLGGRLLWAAGHAACAPALLGPAAALAAAREKRIRRALDTRTVAALSRLSYGALLMHGPVARYMLLGANALSVDLVPLWSYYCGVTAASLLASFLLAVLVETPCCSLLRRLSDCASS